MLQEGLWIKRLASEVGIEVETSESLWSALVQQVEYRLLEGQTLSFDNLGYWFLELQGEFVALDGEQAYLVPPMMSLNITGHSIVEQEPVRVREFTTLAQLADALQIIVPVPLSTIQTWLLSIPKLCLQLLDADHEVMWQGLGLWRRAEGALCFEPMKCFTEHLNRAFEHFKPEPLQEATALADLTRQNISLSHLAEPKVYILPEEKGMSTKPQTAEVGDEEQLPLVSLEPVRDDLREVNNNAGNEMEGQGPSSVEDDAPSPKQRRYKWIYLFVFVVLGLVVILGLKLCQGQNLLQANTLNGLSPKSLLAELKRETKDSLILPPSIGYRDDEAQPYTQASDDSIPNQTKEQGGQNQEPRREAVASNSQPTRTQPEAKPRISDKPKLASSASVVKQSSKGRDEEAKPEVKVSKRDSQRAEDIVLSRGESLAGIAERKYGHRAFWVYIYEENRERIPNPHNIAVGTRLHLPSASKYGIDASNTKSLKQALLLSKSL